ncbi:hypothetical protein MTO98_03980 [Mucilaginibacter sp. SMC90]|uniref:hypothetical protein n=1 Tax=Mucilaginibacter sp. SMC90 TaxID=2929803 RepID=UPI001FB1B38F|nr:hypothetical protein [Mucilaginibacter sp. SMC90]UOE50229.1 hypothetical protein MTO98_03980 [Mucilaginibacter sp. SMC90]
MMEEIKLKKVILNLSILVFAISLTQECYCTSDSCGNSAMALIVGPLGLCFGGAGFSWLANPFLFIAWFSFRKKPLNAVITSVISVALMLSFLFFKQIISDEAGNYSAIVGYKLGYWLWVLSGGIMLVGSILILYRPEGNNNI